MSVDTERRPSFRSVDATAGLAYQPALDGVRAVAVLAVLAFHSEFAWASGGYLGVSVFFTLSGYLIGTLLIVEHDRHGSIDLVAFFDRRVRRLLPASLATLLAVTFVGVAGGFDETGRLASDVRWSALHVANWGQLRADTSYGDLFVGQRSPVQHFWSLAIEEQFYLVVPAVLLGALLFVRRRVDLVGVACAGFVLAAAVAVILATSGGADVAYLNSFARASEIAAGLAVAALLRRARPSPSWAILAVSALLLIVVAVFATGSEVDAWPYRGGLPLFAVVSAVLLVGLQVPGPARSVLSTPVLVVIGRLSYGIYLIHWPVFVWLDADRLGSGGVPLHVVRVSAVVFLSVVSWRFLEQPIRRSTPLPARTFGLAGLSVAGVLAATTLLAPSPVAITDVGAIDEERARAVGLTPRSDDVAPAPETPPAGDDVDAAPPDASTRPAADADIDTHADTDTDTDTDADADTDTDTDTSSPVADEPVRVLVVGDSTAVTIGSALVDWAFDTGDAQVEVAAHGACGLVRGGEYRSEISNAAMGMNCTHIFESQIPATVGRVRPDIVVVMVTLADTWPRSWDGGETWLVATDPEYRRRIVADYDAFLAGILDAGVGRVAWLRPPVSSYADGGDGAGRRDPVDPSFLDGGQEVIEEFVTERAAVDGRVLVLDVRSWFESSGLADDEGARPDGTHLTVDAAQSVVVDYLGPELIAARP